MTEGKDLFYVPPVEEAKKSPDEMSDEFVKFVVENAYTSNQVKEAYYRFVGISDNEESDEAIDALHDKMREMSVEGFPLNRFARIVNAKKEIENDIVPIYHDFVSNLNITDKEKQILQSIVDKDRKGDIEFFIDDEEVGTLTISSREEMTKEHVVAALIVHLGDFVKTVPPGKKYSFMFSEE